MLFVACWLGLGACDDAGLLTPEERQLPIEDLLDGAIVVTRDSNGVTPLAAQATFRTNVAVSVAIQILGAQPVFHEFQEVTTEHTIPILGLYPGKENRVEFRLTDRELSYAVDTLEISTDPLPEFFPSVEVVTADRSRMENGWTLSSLSIGQGDDFRSFPMMFDAKGDIRWYMDLSFLDGMVFMVERFANGNLRFAQGLSVYEYDMLGTEIRRWDMPGYRFHHDVVEKPDGNLLVAVDKVGIGTWEDHIIEIDRSSGAIVNEWDLRQVLDVQRADYTANPPDWFHMNAIWYSEADDALIISGRNQSAIVKVTRENELVWILAPHRGWGRAGPSADGHDTSDFLLTAVGADGVPYADPVQQGDTDVLDFRWPWGQHASMILPNGNLFLFDNGLRRNFYSDGATFSRGVEYAVDESHMTVRQVWQYGEERGDEFYSPIISDVDFLAATGNRLIMPGILFGTDPLAFVTEVTHPSKEVVFEAKIHFQNLFSSGALAWGDFDLVYRSERLPMYPE